MLPLQGKVFLSNSITMMWQSRTNLIINNTQMQKLQKSHVVVFGVGGVGSYAAECICRSGVGSITLIDGDTISESNINRQLPALHSTLNLYKTQVLKERFLDINPNLNIYTIEKMLTPDDVDILFNNNKFSFIIDAIDSLSTKVQISVNAKKYNIPIICSMGAGGRLDVTKIKITDISKTYNDGLAAAFRKKLKKEGIYKGIDVVFSTELANRNSISKLCDENRNGNGKRIVGSISFLPAIFGCTMAGYAINKLINY
ncbi:MAG: tRNA threonylcarbamoyladenosine dehydratase [Bacteroidales bacterium]|jgi:tRNA A37 threonylcarbamoyladenosine dehydratase